MLIKSKVEPYSSPKSSTLTVKMSRFFKSLYRIVLKIQFLIYTSQNYKLFLIMS